HGKAWKGANGCQACHGQTNQHLDTEQSKKTIFSFAKDGGRSAKERAAQCLSCHSSSKHVAFWETSKHKSAGLSCDSCHTGHSNLSKNLKMPQTELCFSCHKDIRSESNRQSHHPIKEGKVSCSDCHDPHGGFGTKMIKADSINELCYNCHAEKRGPFMYEHPPVEENCMTCHSAHGSNHNKLMAQKVPNICQSCHDWSRHPGTPYTQANSFVSSAPAGRGGVARSCQNCHTTIHGSNGPNTLGLRYVK
ncbi:MAG: DmsE family decaheme c-type cytochrome, partial [Proteobacteria bacterium]|nr:DmsE family decaheme c-type cytochrome [Pseudomonadota bacterium]